MKIGIITILKVNNYGAELQAYATQEVLKKMTNLLHLSQKILYITAHLLHRQAVLYMAMQLMQKMQDTLMEAEL